MAEETDMTPVEPVAAEPPKPAPLSNPSVPGSTVKLAPVARKPGAGATVSALRPGLKLPPKPGLATGLKLPPKPGATASALKPGVKLPPKPGATVSALRPGIKLPPKPVIHKPGTTVSAAPLPKPAAPLPKPVTPVPEPVAPAPKPATPVPVDAQGVGKLPTVEAKAIPGEKRWAIRPPGASSPSKPSRP